MIIDKEKGPVVYCKECDMSIRYHFEDISSIVCPDDSGGSKTCYYIECPKCFKQIELKGY